LCNPRSRLASVMSGIFASSLKPRPTTSLCFERASRTAPRPPRTASRRISQDWSSLTRSRRSTNGRSICSSTSRSSEPHTVFSVHSQTLKFGRAAASLIPSNNMPITSASAARGLSGSMPKSSGVTAFARRANIALTAVRSSGRIPLKGSASVPNQLRSESKSSAMPRYCRSYSQPPHHRSPR
jgi:hypothetical protein